MDESNQSTNLDTNSNFVGKHIGKYLIKQTLGSGSFSKTKLGMHMKTGKGVAIKILKPDLSEQAMKTIFTEINALKAIAPHPHVIQLYDYNQELYVKRNSSQMVTYIVIELAAGGELFNLIAQTGRFEEDLCRYYFKQIIDAVSHCHNNGVTHRDLKPENIMLDQEWNLKIIDFGLAAPSEGRDGSGYLKTTLGTYGYMAPEQHLNRVYKGDQVDIFAIGIILFVMHSMHPPFNAATPKDQYYVALASENFETFWKKHSQNKANGDAFYSEEFKDLFQKMTRLDPEKRITMDEIKEHPWVTKECKLTQSDV